MLNFICLTSDFVSIYSNHSINIIVEFLFTLSKTYVCYKDFLMTKIIIIIKSQDFNENN